jgi:hypothetical protein
MPGLTSKSPAAVNVRDDEVDDSRNQEESAHRDRLDPKEDLVPVEMKKEQPLDRHGADQHDRRPERA